MDDDLGRRPEDAPAQGYKARSEVRILGSGEDDPPPRSFSPYSPPAAPQADTRPVETYESPPEQTGLRYEPARPKTAVVKRGPSTCAVFGIIGGLLVLSCMLLAFATLRDGLSGFGRLGGLIPSIDLHLVTTPTVTIDTSRPSVVERVQALSKLETVHYQIEKVISGNSSGPLPAPLTGDKILLVAHGEVVGGVDLSKVTPADVDEVGTAVTLTLPPPEILYSKLDNDKTYVYDRQTGFFNKPDPNLESEVRATAEQQIVQAAQEDGIMQQAETNAQQTLRTLLEGLGYKDVRFKEGQ